jgi:replicative DNA helicase
MQAIGGNGNGREAAICVESAIGSPGGPCRVFISYARTDERYRKRLAVHLVPLVRAGIIDVWSDRTIAAGADWEGDIRRALATADIVLLLVTPNFVASVHCFERELPEAMRRHAEGGLCILPVLVKSVDLVNLPIGKFQGLPTDLRPISAWRDADDAWLQVAQGVRKAAEEIQAARGGRRHRHLPPSLQL